MHIKMYRLHFFKLTSFAALAPDKLVLKKKEKTSLGLDPPVRSLTLN